MLILFIPSRTYKYVNILLNCNIRIESNAYVHYWEEIVVLGLPYCATDGFASHIHHVDMYVCMCIWVCEDMYMSVYVCVYVCID